MAAKKLIIGSRGSELALWQARWVQTELSKHLPDFTITIEIIKTKGDKILDSPLSQIGDKGLFTREIESALLTKQIDLAVHSLKDLPTQLPEGLKLGAITEREDVRDVFIPRPGNPVKKLLDQARGAKIATGSLRRKCQLLAVRPDFEIIDIRGNLNTRMKKLEESDWAGMLLARAGVVRLGWESAIGETLDGEMILPAVGQGALGIEIREGDESVEEIIRVLHHFATAQAAIAERALLRKLEGGCQVPIGTLAKVERDSLTLTGLVGSLDGKTVVRDSRSGDIAQAETIGYNLADALRAAGAGAILKEIRSGASAVEKTEV